VLLYERCALKYNVSIGASETEVVDAREALWPRPWALTDGYLTFFRNCLNGVVQ
jgi:hypothetical protein